LKLTNDIELKSWKYSFIILTIYIKYKLRNWYLVGIIVDNIHLYVCTQIKKKSGIYFKRQSIMWTNFMNV